MAEEGGGEEGGERRRGEQNPRSSEMGQGWLCLIPGDWGYP